MGSATLSNGGGSIADLIVQEKRGAALSMLTLGPLLGPGECSGDVRPTEANSSCSYWTCMWRLLNWS